MNQTNFAVDKLGTITKWTSMEGVDIICQKHKTPGGRYRGTCFIAAPLFGKSPETKAWAGTSLPQHGLVRLLDDNYQVVSGFESSTRTHYRDFNIRPSDEYPWGFNVGAQIIHSSPHLIDYWLSVGRMPGCSNKKQMPLSFGLHPYFATHSESWRITSGDTEVTDSRQCHKDAKYFDCVRGEPMFLQTSQGIVKLELGEFDRVVIWSDNPEYVCIEPTQGLREELLLNPRDMKHGRCKMEFIEAPSTYTRRFKR